MARAVTDSIAFQVYDVFQAMSSQSPTPLGRLYADGGPSKNDFLMQCVADTLNHAIVQCDAPEASALGAAYLAGLSLGIWPDVAAIAALPRPGTLVTPRVSDSTDRLKVWRDAIYRSTVSGPSFMSE
jgi:glycerol kinase